MATAGPKRAVRSSLAVGGASHRGGEGGLATIRAIRLGPAVGGLTAGGPNRTVRPSTAVGGLRRSHRGADGGTETAGSRRCPSQNLPSPKRLPRPPSGTASHRHAPTADTSQRQLLQQLQICRTNHPPRQPDADKKDWGFLYNYLLTNAPWHVMRHRTGGCNDGYLIACPRCSAELFISTPSIGKDGNDSKHINEIQRRLIEFLWGSWARFAELYPHVAPACKDSFCTVETLVPGSVVAV